MSFPSILDTLFLGPIKLIFETIFSFSFALTGNVVLSIFCLSLVINVLVLPLYMCADRMQAQAKKRIQDLKPGITHIKKTFKGDERMMMLQTYYKQNHYSPLSSLSGTISLVLQIPFFIAAYQFLSNISLLNGTSFGAITNLAKPDNLIMIGSFAINVLPIIMTIINIVASMIHTKGSEIKDKIQLFAMAGLFLVLLYNAPAGVVLYWTLNNAFSLIKTIFYKIKNPKKILTYLLSIAGFLLIFIVLVFNLGTIWAKLVALLISLIVQIPMIVYLIRLQAHKKCTEPKEPKTYIPNRRVFVIGCAFLTLLIGVLIPATYIAASPEEFINASYFVNPIWFVVSSICYSIGTFLIWFQVFYFLANDKAKVIFEKVVLTLCIISVINYFFFGLNLGNIDSSLNYDTGFLAYTAFEIIFNTLVMAGLITLMFFAIKKFKKVLTSVMVLMIVATGGMSTLNTIQITSSVSAVDITSQQSEQKPSFELSSTGKNVMVIILDRAMGVTVPYIFNEKSELKEDFYGFTYYNNVISYGGNTNFAIPALLGGYDYTPVELNKRDDLKLVEKQNQANLLIPRVMTEQWEGCDKAYVFNPVYANYKWISDLSIFDGYDKISATNIGSFFTTAIQQKWAIEHNYRNFFYFSLMRTLPVVLQYLLYDDGIYNRISTNENENSYTNQVASGTSIAYGLDNHFMQNYNNLINIKNMMNITDANVNRYVSIYNSITHEPVLVDETTYEPASKINNTKYDEEHADRFTLGDSSIKVTNLDQMKHYQTNVLTFVELAKLFNHMKQQGIYDNTRIIIVADHGLDWGNYTDELTLENFNENVEGYFPLLMVKDFYSSTEFKTSSEFMTNADVPTIAFDGLIAKPTNPFIKDSEDPNTNKLITNTEKTAHDQYLIQSGDWNVSSNNGKSFNPSQWFRLKIDGAGSNIWDKNNWEFFDKYVVLKNHENPS